MITILPEEKGRCVSGVGHLRAVVFFIIVFFSMPSAILQPAYAEAEFVPWNAKVRVADENILPMRKRHPRFRTVYNGPQGGAYLLIRFFQVVISPQDGPNCRFDPVCSAYGKHAVEKHGFFLGMMMACERIIRCNPYNPPGKDPCPDKILRNRRNR